MNNLEKELYKVIRSFVNFPFGQICVHSASLEILNALEKSGYNIPDDLVKSISKSSNGDEESIKILDKLLKNE